MNFLIDYNLTGDAALFWGTLSAEGWLDLLPIRFFTFQDVGFESCQLKGSRRMLRGGVLPGIAMNRDRGCLLSALTAAQILLF